MENTNSYLQYELVTASISTKDKTQMHKIKVKFQIRYHSSFVTSKRKWEPMVTTSIEHIVYFVKQVPM